MTEKLSVCFVWHMHQPLYKDRLTGRYLLPWVRLHAIKDYLDMVKILEDFPKIRQTFNLVPSLLEQMEDYAWHDAIDDQLLLTCKDISELTDADKVYLLEESFHANFSRQIKIYPSYLELYNKRQVLAPDGKITPTILSNFSNQAYADMATWLNLAWFDPMWVREYPLLQNLVSKGKNFSLSERREVIALQRELIQKIIPTYRELQEKGQIEVTTTPYYHPILPLLIDTNTARLANPKVNLPEKLFFHGVDAQAQLSKGLAQYEANMACSARGMWPSELSVSPATLELIAQAGINWVVVDEALLAITSGKPIFRDEHGNLNSAELLCQPYQICVGDEKLNVVFREVVTSNEISFSYGHRSAEEAASSLYMRLKHIQQRLFNWYREGVVVIALDGENCWEAYEDDGRPFLQELYRRLSLDTTLNVCTVSDYLQRNPPTEKLYNIHCGSWIGADYHIWIGDPIKNKAWDLLGETRDFLVQQLKQKPYSQELANQAWEEIYAAEGSDWFWWFGEPNSSPQDPMFDQQFRLRLQNVYKILGCPYPEQLDLSVTALVILESTQEEKLLAR